MKKNQNIDIVPYICIGGITIAMLILMACMNRWDAKHIEQQQKLHDTMLVVDMLTKNIEELNAEIEALKQTQAQMQEAMIAEVIEEEIATYTPVINYDYDYVLRVVAAESRGESLEGQMAVAQCIRETAEATGQTPEQVVKAKNQYASPVSMSVVTDSVREACERVFINGESITDEPIRYFYSTTGGFVSKWHENSLQHVMTIGCHKFFKK